MTIALVKVLEKKIFKSLMSQASFTRKEFPKSLGKLLEKEREDKGRKLLRIIWLKPNTDKKLRLLAHNLRCSKGELIRVVLDFKLLSQEELRIKYMTP